jgi:hypothetical protein
MKSILTSYEKNLKYFNHNIITNKFKELHIVIKINKETFQSVLSG